MKLEKVLAIGNGESRKDLSLADYSIYKIGCNAVVRDLDVNEVVCVDNKILQEVANITATTTAIYTRDRLQTGVSRETLQLPLLPYTGTLREDNPIHWGSGPYAVLLAAIKSKSVIMVGFDLYGLKSKVNNCYKNTNYYNSEDSRAVDPRYWIHQIGKVFECFPDTEFCIYQTPEWQMPEKWILPNVFLDNINRFTYN